MTKPRILILDIETLPNITFAYDLWNPKKPDMIIQEKSILTFAYKWYGENKTHVMSVLDYQLKDKLDPYDDLLLVADIIKLMEEADYVVAHYGDKFDIRFIHSRALINGLTPPPSVPSIDTCKLAKKYFHLNSNRLDYIGKVLGFGGKMSMGWQYWERSAKGDVEAIEKMAKYNKRDVDLLEKIFEKIIPFCSTKLNYKLFNKNKLVCESCGSSHIQKRGTVVTKSVKKQRNQCMDCGHWFHTKLEK